ncbi:hypothetical protein [Hydrogenobaculum acidophilum]
MSLKPSYILYFIGFLIACFLALISFGEKLLIARYILAKNGYYIYYKKAKEYLTSIDLEDAKVFHKKQNGYQYIARLSYLRAGFYPPFILNVSFTCSNGYTNIRENMLLKHIKITSKRFPISCIKTGNEKGSGQMNSQLELTPASINGFINFNMLNIKGYLIKNLKLNFRKTHFHFRGKVDILNTSVDIKGDGIVSIDQNTLTNSKISGSGLINTPFKSMHIVFGGTVVNPSINIQ